MLPFGFVNLVSLYTQTCKPKENKFAEQSDAAWVGMGSATHRFMSEIATDGTFWHRVINARGLFICFVIPISRRNPRPEESWGSGGFGDWERGAACSCARAPALSALTHVVSASIGPVSAARGVWLLGSLWLDRFQVFFHVINKKRCELEIVEHFMLTIAALKLSQSYRKCTNLEVS